MTLSLIEQSIPTVSIILPTYNRAELIGDAISSVLAQSYGDFELIVVDDGSTDATAEVVDSFRDPRIVFLQQENRGRAAARNKAIMASRGRYIAFLDSDDEYLDQKLDLQVAYMDSHSDIGMVYTSAYCIDERGRPLDRHTYVASVAGDIYKDVAFFRPVTITLPTVMLRREVLDSVGYFDEAMERFEDTDLWRRVAKRYRVGIIVEPTCRLRTHRQNSLMAQNPGTIIAAIEYYVAKVFREDADLGTPWLKEGASRLYEYYGKAFLSIPQWRHHGVVLLVRSMTFAPRQGARILFAGLTVFAGSLVRRCLAAMK